MSTAILQKLLHVICTCDLLVVFLEVWVALFSFFDHLIFLLNESPQALVYFQALQNLIAVIGYFVLKDDEQPHLGPSVAESLVEVFLELESVHNILLDFLVASQLHVGTPDSLEVVFSQEPAEEMLTEAEQGLAHGSYPREKHCT